ncbi:uncharacterized protein LOC125431520 isoform X3 [Sphaerodactylus townsendi]|uniref:uncharacterized protein LOC125431520 isoform X3 n=1 Tax=Sphaerodactylus townsendi TaxID=933632 RepID=UPI002025D369|nr:uncharacterized protein LOC125431520 isoform X3 [Sphaerodactylus townsendi]
MGGEKPEANGQLRLLLPQPPKSGFLRPPPSRENTGCRLSRTNSGARPASDPRVSLEVCLRIDDMSADILDQGFPACWLSSLNTEVDLLWKMIFVVLLQRLPREFLIW